MSEENKNQKIIDAVEASPRHKGKRWYLLHLKGEHISPSAAIKAKCYDCQGYYTDGAVDCKNTTCPLYQFAPYGAIQAERMAESKKRRADKRASKKAEEKAATQKQAVAQAEAGNKQEPATPKAPAKAPAKATVKAPAKTQPKVTKPKTEKTPPQNVANELESQKQEEPKKEAANA